MKKGNQLGKGKKNLDMLQFYVGRCGLRKEQEWAMGIGAKLYRCLGKELLTGTAVFSELTGETCSVC